MLGRGFDGSSPSQPSLLWSPGLPRARHGGCSQAVAQGGPPLRALVCAPCTPGDEHPLRAAGHRLGAPGRLDPWQH